MPKIFISYRREDRETESHLICKRLKSQFGADSVFIDVDAIPPGVDFRKHLNDEVSKCDVLLAVIGARWLDAKGEDGRRRIDDEGDFVRLEIEAALKRKILVVPVVVGHTSMPGENDLPESLADFAYRNAEFVRSGRDFERDVERIIPRLEIAARYTYERLKQAVEEKDLESIREWICGPVAGRLTGSHSNYRDVRVHQSQVDLVGVDQVKVANVTLLWLGSPQDQGDVKSLQIEIEPSLKCLDSCRRNSKGALAQIRRGSSYSSIPLSGATSLAYSVFGFLLSRLSLGSLTTSKTDFRGIYVWGRRSAQTPAIDEIRKDLIRKRFEVMSYDRLLDMIYQDEN